MHITIHNLGVIKEAEIDLKPLTIFIGPNNVGKTWLAYTLMGIFSPYGWQKYIKAYIKGDVPKAYPPLDEAIEQVLNDGNATIDLVKFADKYGEKYFNNVARLAQRWMPSFMATDRVSFNELEVSISLTETKTHFLERVLNASLRIELSVGRRGQNPLLSILKKPGDEKLFIYTSTEEKISEKLPDEAIQERVVSSILAGLQKALYPNVYVLPTERTTFITFPTFISRTPDREVITSTEKPLQEQKVRTMIVGGPVANDCIYFPSWLSR